MFKSFKKAITRWINGGNVSARVHKNLVTLPVTPPAESASELANMRKSLLGVMSQILCAKQAAAKQRDIELLQAIEDIFCYAVHTQPRYKYPRCELDLDCNEITAAFAKLESDCFKDFLPAAEKFTADRWQAYAAAWAYYSGGYYGSVTPAIKAFEAILADNYLYLPNPDIDSLDDVGVELIGDKIPDGLEDYFDYAAYARDYLGNAYDSFDYNCTIYGFFAPNIGY